MFTGPYLLRLPQFLYPIKRNHPIAVLGYLHQLSPSLPPTACPPLATCHERWLCFLNSYLLSAQISCRQWKTCQGQAKTSKQRQPSCEQKPRTYTCCHSSPSQVQRKLSTAAMPSTSLLVEIKADSGHLLFADTILVQPIGVTNNRKRKTEIHTPEAADATVKSAGSCCHSPVTSSSGIR